MKVSDGLPTTFAPASLAEQAVEFINGLLRERVGAELFSQAAVGVHDRGVVAVAEGAADFGVAKVGELAGEVNNDVASLHERTAARGAREGGLGDAEVPRGDG
jgi:hypothetical protein